MLLLLLDSTTQLMNELGPFKPLSILLSAIIGLATLILGIWGKENKWQVSLFTLPQASKIIATILFAILIYVVYELSEQFPNNLWIPLAIAALVVFVLFGYYIWLVTQYKFSNGENKGILGGSKPTSLAKELIENNDNDIVTIQEVYQHVSFEEDRVWTRRSMSSIRSRAAMLYTSMITIGSVAVFAGVLFLQGALNKENPCENCLEVPKSESRIYHYNAYLEHQNISYIICHKVLIRFDSSSVPVNVEYQEWDIRHNLPPEARGNVKVENIKVTDLKFNNMILQWTFNHNDYKSFTKVKFTNDFSIFLGEIEDEVIVGNGKNIRKFDVYGVPKEWPIQRNVE